MAKQSWLDRVQRGGAPLYLAIADALQEAVRDGALEPGERLPAQRAVAEHLGADLTTVTRAYSLAKDRGLIEGTVGRGSYVRRSPTADEAEVVDLSMVQPPRLPGDLLAQQLQRTVGELLQKTDPSKLMAYHPVGGAVGQRAAGAAWLAPTLSVDPARLLVCGGAQPALAAILSVLCRPGDALVVEALTYPGIKSLASQFGVRLIPCPVDRDGLDVEALARLAGSERAAALYVVPTLNNPTTATLPEARRRRVGEIVRERGLWLIEDDPYSRLLDAPPPAVASFAPERSFHIATVSKTLAPGLRTAFVACPDVEMTSQVANALRALSLMAPPLLTAAVTRWIREGVAEELLLATRAEVRRRRRIAQSELPAAVGPEETLHVWLPLPDGLGSERFRLAAQARGLSVVGAEEFAVGPPQASGVRISLGATENVDDLAKALRELARLLGGGLVV